MEVLSVLLTPLVLIFSLPNSASAIVDFVRDHSKYVDGIGAVCDYSLFDFDRYGSVTFGPAEGGREDDKQKPANGKMEQSFVSFKGAHPDWAGDERSQGMLDRLAAFRAAKEAERDGAIAGALQQSLLLQGGRSVMGAAQADDVVFAQQQQQQQGRLPSAVDAQQGGAGAPPGVKQGVWGPLGYVAADAAPAKTRARQSALSVVGASNISHSSSAFPNPMMQRSALLQQSGATFALNRSDGDALNLPSILRSILKQENIDYENDFYWMTRFQQERAVDPVSMERSLSQSMSVFGLHEAAAMRENNFSIYDES